MLATGGSVATRWIGGGGALATDTLATWVWSNTMLIGRLLRGGEYGGGGSGEALSCKSKKATRGVGELTLRFLVRLGSLDVLHSIRNWTGDRRGDPLLRIVWLDGAQGGLAG